ncbi:mycofactocin-coupled SDR family oxidoreductase [Georgenia subflava]|uniref:Mycofactocin-coupled SDR family oxidoreductase n=1 Tax=Georgenia subflava TaxID=1622177 RepID=A0A6N7ECN8_9MICO|nr:mycofactocin-coupled SDR family oxidoreductase [Georgenia subflava]MPV35740.1 mycofactocin-coupled SDR family oxidoreductase [Georgenia subflava]
MARLDGKVAFITGAARGMGRAHAVRLAQEGADIIAVDLARDEPSIDYRQGTPEDLAETVALVEAEGRRIVARTADVRDQAALETAVADGVAELGGIDVLVSNAGISNQTPALDLTDQQWQDILSVNLVGAWHAVKAVVPGMIERGRGGSVVIISSTAGLIGAPNQAHYTASKHGLQGLMGTLANELGQHSIRVNTVNPGMVNTEMAMNERLLKAYIPDVENPTPDDVARVFGGLALLPTAWVEPEDVSNAVLWLASEESRFVTGISVPVDAGLLAKF